MIIDVWHSDVLVTLTIYCNLSQADRYWARGTILKRINGLSMCVFMTLNFIRKVDMLENRFFFQNWRYFINVQCIDTIILYRLH